MSNSSILKKKESLNDTFSGLCNDLLRFIDRKIIKKYISPNIAQLPKEMRNSEKWSDSKKAVWTYFYKDKDLTEEEKIKDVFKDDKFLGYLQNLTNSLHVVINYIEQNQKNIKKLEEELKNKEEKINSLNELKNLLNNYFEKNSNDSCYDEQKSKNDFLEDQHLLNIMNKIQSFNNIKNKNKLTTNVTISNNNKGINNNSKNEINNSYKYFTNIDFNIIGKNKNQHQYYSHNNNIYFINKKEENDFSNQCFNSTNPSNTNISNEKKSNFNEKNKINKLIDNLKFNNSNNVDDDNNIDSEDNYQFFKKDKEEENLKENLFLNKKLGRLKERKVDNDKSESISYDNIKYVNNININDNLLSEKKKGKNKKKKSSEYDNNNIENGKLISLKEEKINLPILKPILEKDKEVIRFESEYLSKEKNYKSNKKENIIEEIDEDILKQLLDETEKEKDNKSKNLSLEELFNSELKKKFYELSPNNKRIKIIEDILSLIKTKDIKNYNPRINGPYLVGSYRTIPNLPLINYSSPIDLMYTYKDILIDKKILDYTVNNIIKDILNLNIIDIDESFENNNEIKKIRIKCTSKINISIILYFNIYFVDIGFEQYEKIINNIIFNDEKMNFENKEEENKFINIILYLRGWRKKYRLLFIIPELLDEIAKKYFEPCKTMALTIFNVFYDLYNCINDVNHKKNQGIVPKNKILMENLIKKWFDNEKNIQEIKTAVLETNTLLNSRNIHSLFNFSKDE